jgi:hypothetical protein
MLNRPASAFGRVADRIGGACVRSNVGVIIGRDLDRGTDFVRAILDRINAFVFGRGHRTRRHDN